KSEPAADAAAKPLSTPSCWLLTAPPEALSGFSLLPDEMIILILEENVKRGKGTVNSRDILLQLHFFSIRKDLVDVDLLLHDPQTIADHHNLMKKSLDGNALQCIHLKGTCQEKKLS